jgi:hypothetical protein
VINNADNSNAKEHSPNPGCHEDIAIASMIDPNDCATREPPEQVPHIGNEAAQSRCVWDGPIAEWSNPQLDFPHLAKMLDQEAIAKCPTRRMRVDLARHKGNGHLVRVGAIHAKHSKLRIFRKTCWWWAAVTSDSKWPSNFGIAGST